MSKLAMINSVIGVERMYTDRNADRNTDRNTLAMINSSDRTGRLIFEDYQLLTDCWISWRGLPAEVGTQYRWFDFRHQPYKYKYI